MNSNGKKITSKIGAKLKRDSTHRDTGRRRRAPRPPRRPDPDWGFPPAERSLQLQESERDLRSREFRRMTRSPPARMISSHCQHPNERSRSYPHQGKNQDKVSSSSFRNLAITLWSPIETKSSFQCIFYFVANLQQF